MTVRFEDEVVDRVGRLSLGLDRETGGFYLSLPVSNAQVDYEEYYSLSAGEFARFKADLAGARAFAERCRARLEDDRLILKPGSDRGEPR